MNPSDRRDAIIASIGDLSVSPRVIRHLSAFLNDPNSDITPAIDALKVEPVLTGAMLAACNAPGYYRGEKLVDLEAAVMRLGIRETYRIALLITFRQGLRIPNLPDNRAADYLWARAITTGCAMELAAGSPDAAPAAYTVGLLHLIGCFVLARNGFTPLASDVTHPAFLLRAQEAACGMGYPEAGGLALQYWEFPPEIWKPVLYQLTPNKAGEHAPIASALSEASTLALEIEESRPDSAGYDPAHFVPDPDDDLAIRTEAASADLMQRFFSVPPKRPNWAKPAKPR